jgi:N-acetylglucosaminyl-diphospho-decaprenol L-rhamnosyltransferase
MRETPMQFLIVNYRTPDLTIRCVESMTAVGISEYDIVIVDNHSEDNSVTRISSALPKLRLIESDHNGGFSAGINLGMKHIDAKYALILNPDTLFISNFVKDVTNVLERDETIAVVGLNLLNPDLSPQYSARRFYSFLDILVRRSGLRKLWPWRLLEDRHLMKKELASGLMFDADWVLGTGFVIRKAVYDKLHGMDEEYFLYMEDVDLCARTWEAQYRVVCLPAAAIIHDHQRESAKSLTSKASKQHLRSLRRFHKKHNVPVFSARKRESVLRRPSVLPPSSNNGQAVGRTLSR